MAGLSLYDNDKSKVTLTAYSYLNGNYEKLVHEFDFNNFSRFNHNEANEYYMQHNLEAVEHKTSIEELICNEGRKSHITFPLYQKEELIGELIFAFDEVLEIDDDKLFVLVEISHHFSVAVMQLVLEEKLQLHADELKKSVAEKEILLSEIHHRVKNNLQIISSFLFLQSKKITDESILAIFKETQNRVKTLALVHEKLYKSTDLSRVDFAEYIKNLVSHIKSSYHLPAQRIEMKFDLDNLFLPIDKAVPLGLIINELITNSFKYAFPDNNSSDQNFILIKFKSHEEGKILLAVIDNGVGMPENFNPNETNSLGYKIVWSLTAQIDGELKINSKENTEVEIFFDNNHKK